MPAARRPYHHGNLRRELLDAALALFVARGTFDFTLRELAREAGVTHNAPYRHFAGKNELVSALRVEGFAKLAAACQASLGAAPRDHRARVRALGEAYVRFAAENPHQFRLILGSAPSDSFPDVRLRRTVDADSKGDAFTLLYQALDAARREGVVRSDLATREIALGAWALVHGLASLIVEGHVRGDDARIRKYVKTLDKLFFEGALASSSAASNCSRLCCG